MLTGIYIFLCIPIVLAQPATELDPDLYNGKVYNFSTYMIKGHQFFDEKEFTNGSIFIAGKSYHDLLINYDIYNQELVFKTGESVGKRFISLPTEVVDSFEMAGCRFIITHIGGSGRQILEKVGDGTNYFVKQWVKETKPSTENEVTNYTFSDPMQYLYFISDKGIFRIKKKKELLLLVSEENRSDLRKILRKQRVNLRRSENKTLARLLEQINGYLM